MVGRRIAAARTVAGNRAGSLNAMLSGRALRAACGLDRGGLARAIELADGAGLTARATERLLRVARTIADLAGAATVEVTHLEEAARFRVPPPEGHGHRRVSA